MRDDDVELDRVDVLPDSRAKAGRGAKPIRGIAGVRWLEPVYCANCGRKAGYATQVESLNFVFVLCDDCGRTSGIIEASNALTPDEKRWRHIKEEQLDVHGRELTPEELTKIVASDTSPLATLLKQGR